MVSCSCRGALRSGLPWTIVWQRPRFNSAVPAHARGVDFCRWQFAAHPSCQKKLTTLWYGDGGFDKILRRRSKLVQIVVVACIILLYPVLSVIYVIAPNSLVSIVYSVQPTVVTRVPVFNTYQNLTGRVW